LDYATGSDLVSPVNDSVSGRHFDDFGVVQKIIDIEDNESNCQVLSQVPHNERVINTAALALPDEFAISFKEPIATRTRRLLERFDNVAKDRSPPLAHFKEFRLVLGF